MQKHPFIVKYDRGQFYKFLKIGLTQFEVLNQKLFEKQFSEKNKRRRKKRQRPAELGPTPA